MKLARAIFIRAFKWGIKMGQKDACLFVVLDFGLVCLFAEKAMDKFEAHSVALILYALLRQIQTVSVYARRVGTILPALIGTLPVHRVLRHDMSSLRIAESGCALRWA